MHTGPFPGEPPNGKVQVFPASSTRLPDLPDPSTLTELPRARDALQNPSVNAMMKFNLDTLRTLCSERGIAYLGKSRKADLIEKLFAHVSPHQILILVTC